MRRLTLPAYTTRDECDRVFAVARGREKWPRESSSKVEYQLLSRGAYPTDPEVLVARVRGGDTHAIDEAIAWLRFDPFCLWSGYLKRTLMRSIAQQKLSERQAEAIRSVLLDVLPRGKREEFRDACRLARAVNSPRFRGQLREMLGTADPDTHQRVRWMLDGCERTAIE